MSRLGNILAARRAHPHRKATPWTVAPEQARRERALVRWAKEHERKRIETVVSDLDDAGVLTADQADAVLEAIERGEVAAAEPDEPIPYRVAAKRSGKKRRAP